MNDAESLKKSHSKSSNAKLTLLCLLASVALAGIFVFLGLGLQGVLFSATIDYIIAGVCAGVEVLCFLAFASFKR